MALLEIQDLHKSFGAQEVLKGISLFIAHGEFVTLLGPSGCGKTTLLRLLMGLEAPDSGQIRIPEGTRFSAVFQEDRLLNRLINRQLS